MNEAERRGVQRLAVKIQSFQYLAMAWASAPVNRIPDQRVPDRGHVNPDLMGPSGLQPALDPGRITADRQPCPVGHRPLAAAFTVVPIVIMGLYLWGAKRAGAFDAL